MALDYKTDAALQKRLHDELAYLVSLPNNNVCCDCGAITPKWASVNLGVFICIRCAGIHRSIGTHITKVRSITLDSWTEDQVDVMRKVGNSNAKRIWENNSNVMKKPDMDQHRLERFIRDKYERKRFFNQQAFDDVMAGNCRTETQNGAENSRNNAQNENSGNYANNTNNTNFDNQSKQLNFMPPSKYGHQKRNSQQPEQLSFNNTNNQNVFNNTNNLFSTSPIQQKSPQIQQAKSADVFDFGPDIQFQDSFEVQPAKNPSKSPNPSSQNFTNNDTFDFGSSNNFTNTNSNTNANNGFKTASPGGNVFDFLDAAEVQTIPQQNVTQNNPKPAPRQNMTQNLHQNFDQQPVQNQPKYQKKSDILFSQPTQPTQQTNIFDSMGGNQFGMNKQQQHIDMTQKTFDFMSLYQQPQRQTQQNYGGMQQGGMYNQMNQRGQMYGQQNNYGGMQQGGMQMPQRDYSSIGKYYV